MGLTQGQGEAAPDKKQEDKFSCVPVTIRVIQSAIADAEGGDVKIFGEEPSMLSLVAAAEEVQKQNTSVELTLNDGTGRFKARYFLTDPSKQKSIDEIKPGTYVSLFGNLRTAPTNHFSALGIRPVQSADEVSFHGIEVAHAYLKLKTRKAGYSTPAPAVAVKPTQAEPPSQAAAPAQAAPPSQPTPAATANSKPAMSDEEMKAAVVAFLAKESPSKGDTGVAFSEVTKHLGSGAEEQKVRAVLVQIVDDGDAFNTIDDDHFSAL